MFPKYPSQELRRDETAIEAAQSGRRRHKKLDAHRSYIAYLLRTYPRLSSVKIARHAGVLGVRPAVVGGPGDTCADTRSPNLKSAVHCGDQVLFRMAHAEVVRSLKPVVKPGKTELCLDTHFAFLNLEHTLYVSATRFASSRNARVRDNIYHVQSVNNYLERLGSWICRRYAALQRNTYPIT